MSEPFDMGLFKLHRPGDPPTSVQAAEDQLLTLTQKQNMVMDVLLDHPAGLHDQDLTQVCAGRYHWPVLASTARTRRAELVAKGRVFDSGRTGRTDAGKKTVIWTTTPPLT